MSDSEEESFLGEGSSGEEESSSEEEKRNEDAKTETASPGSQVKKEKQRKKREGYSKQVYIGNLNFEMTEKDLKKFFVDCGTIEKVYYPMDFTQNKDKPRPKGFAILTFSSEEEAAEAVDLDGSEVKGRKLQVRHRTKGHLTKKPKDCRTIFMSNLNFKSREEDIKKHFADCGEIVEVRIPKSKKGFSFGNAYVEFTDTKHVDKAIELNESSLGGRQITVNWALPDSVSKMQKKIQESLTLFVSNLPRNAGLDKIQSFIEQSGVSRGNVQIRLQKKPDGTSKGLCFLDFKEMNDAFSILKKNDTVFNGRRLNISVSMPRESTKRKRDEEVGPRKKIKMSWIDKRIQHVKQNRTCILHGVPRSFRYEQVQEVISEYKPTSFSRHKASIAITFDSREEMLECLQATNSKLQYNEKVFKLNAAVPKPKGCYTIQLHGCPKTLTNEEITKTLQKDHPDVSHCYRDKKIVFCDLKSNELKTALLQGCKLKIGEQNVLVRK